MGQELITFMKIFLAPRIIIVAVLICICDTITNCCDCEVVGQLCEYYSKGEIDDSGLFQCT